MRDDIQNFAGEAYDVHNIDGVFWDSELYVPLLDPDSRQFVDETLAV